MTLYEKWQQLAEMQQTEQEQLAYWQEYFAAETENYKKFSRSQTRFLRASYPSWQSSLV